MTNKIIQWFFLGNLPDFFRKSKQSFTNHIPDSDRIQLFNNIDGPVCVISTTGTNEASCVKPCGDRNAPRATEPTTDMKKLRCNTPGGGCVEGLLFEGVSMMGSVCFFDDFFVLFYDLCVMHMEFC